MNAVTELEQEIDRAVAPVYLTRKEAATYLGISAQTHANNRHRGPHYHKFFGSVRYSVADLDAWAKQQRR